MRLRRGPRRGHRRQPYPLQICPDRSRIGQGGDDPQAPPTGRACADVGGKHPCKEFEVQAHCVEREIGIICHTPLA